MASDQFKYDRNSLDNLNQSILDHEKTWNVVLNDLINSVNAFYNSTNIDGDAGTALKNYAKDTYGTINTSLQTILYAHSGGWSQYLTELNAIDGSSKLKIHGQVLTDTSADLDTELTTISEIDVGVGNVIKSVSDIFTSPSRNVADVVNVQSALKTSVDTLKTDLQSLDSTHATADFANSTEEISALEKYITTNDNTNRDSVDSYTRKSVDNTNAEEKLAETNEKLTQQADDNSDKWDAAKEKQLAHVEEVKAERQAKTDRWKIVASVACIAASVALMAIPGVGLGVAIAAGAAMGALNAVVTDAADEYAQHGDFNQLNVKKMAGDVVVEASIGAATAWVGGSSLDGVGKYAAKGGIHFVEGTYESFNDYYKTHENSFTGMKLSDVGECFVDGSISAVAGTAGDAVGDKAGKGVGNLTQNTKISLGAQNTKKLGRLAGQISQSTAKSLTKGTTKRVTETVLDFAVKGEKIDINWMQILKDSINDVSSGVCDGIAQHASNQIAYDKGWDQSVNTVAAASRGESVDVTTQDLINTKRYARLDAVSNSLGSVCGGLSKVALSDEKDKFWEDDPNKALTKFADDTLTSSQKLGTTYQTKMAEVTYEKNSTILGRKVDLTKVTNTQNKAFLKNFNRESAKQATINAKGTTVYEDSGRGAGIKDANKKTTYTNMKFTRKSGSAK